MTNMVENIAESWSASPLAVLEAPAMLRGTTTAPVLTAAFWSLGDARSRYVSSAPQDDYAILAFHLDAKFGMDLQIDRSGFFRGQTGPGDFCLIPPGQEPEAEVTGGQVSALHMYLPSDLFHRLIPTAMTGEPLFGQSPRMAKPIARLLKWRDAMDGSDETQFAAYGALLQTVGLLSKALAPMDTGERLTPRMVRRATEIMQKNLAEPLKVADLAAALNLSEAHFARAFRNTTGQTPGEALRELRMEKARDLLSGDTLGMIEIAAEVGYADPSHFAKVFRDRYGMSPGKWRKDRQRGLIVVEPTS